MKNSDILSAIFLLAILIFLAGLFGGADITKICIIILSALGFAAIPASWGALPSIPIGRRPAISLALIDAFVFLLIMLVAVFLLRGFIFTSINLDYAIFGILLINLLLVRLLALKVMGK